MLQERCFAKQIRGTQTAKIVLDACSLREPLNPNLYVFLFENINRRGHIVKGILEGYGIAVWGEFTLFELAVLAELCYRLEREASDADGGIFHNVHIGVYKHKHAIILASVQIRADADGV